MDTTVMCYEILKSTAIKWNKNNTLVVILWKRVQYFILFYFFSSTTLLLPTHLPPPLWTHAQSYNPMDCIPPGSSVHGLFQARILEWVAISFSKESNILILFILTFCVCNICKRVLRRIELFIQFPGPCHLFIFLTHTHTHTHTHICIYTHTLSHTYFLPFGCIVWHVGSSFPTRGSNLCPLSGKRGVLTTRLPERSQPPLIRVVV